MTRRWIKLLRFPTLVVGTSASVFLLNGCADPNDPAWGGAKDPRTKAAPLETNIVAVAKYFSADPWLVFDNDGSGRIDGVRCAVYLMGPNGPKGVFGTGTLQVEMYRLDTDAKGKETATLVHKWELPADQAYVWQSKKETALGWGYGLRLRWPKEIDAQGSVVAFVVKYLREDGRVVSSTRNVMRVPKRGGAPVAT